MEHWNGITEFEKERSKKKERRGRNIIDTIYINRPYLPVHRHNLVTETLFNVTTMSFLCIQTALMSSPAPSKLSWRKCVICKREFKRQDHYMEHLHSRRSPRECLEHYHTQEQGHLLGLQATPTHGSDSKTDDFDGDPDQLPGSDKNSDNDSRPDSSNHSHVTSHGEADYGYEDDGLFNEQDDIYVGDDDDSFPSPPPSPPPDDDVMEESGVGATTNAAACVDLETLIESVEVPCRIGYVHDIIYAHLSEQFPEEYRDNFKVKPITNLCVEKGHDTDRKH